MKSKNNHKYEIKRQEMSYNDVIIHNYNKFHNLGYEDDFSYRSKDDKKWNVSTFFLKGGKGKKEKFYNENDSIIMDYKSFINVDSTLVKRNLFRKDVNNKKFIIISLPKYDMKLLHKYGMIWLSGQYDDTNDSENWYSGEDWDDQVEDIRDMDKVIRTLPNNFGDGFFDIMDGNYFFIIPSHDVLYDDNFGLMMNVRGQQGENEPYDKKKVKGFLSTWVEVDIPNSVDVLNGDYRVISEKIHNYKNGTSKIEVSMSEMYQRLSKQTGEFYDGKTMNKEWFGDEFVIPSLTNYSDESFSSPSRGNYKGSVGISNSFTDEWDGYGKYTPSLDDSIDIEDSKKVEIVLDSLDERRKEVHKGFRKWKRDTSKRLDEIINHLQEGKKSLLNNSKEIDKVLKEKNEYDTNLKQFRDTWVEDNLPNWSKGYKEKVVPNGYEKITKELVMGEQGYRNHTGILTMLSVDTLKKMRTSSSPFFRELFQDSKITDTSKSRNSYKDILDLRYGKIGKVEKMIFREFYGLGDEESIVSTPNENRQLNYLLYGSNDYEVFFVERFVKLVIGELELFISNNKLKKNHDLYKSEIEMLKDKYLRDTNHFLDIPIPTLDKVNENMELLSWMDDYSDRIIEMKGIKKIEIPTKPNPMKEEK